MPVLRPHAQHPDDEILPQYRTRSRIVYKDYPLISIHPWAQHAANDANCLAKESGPGYWQTGGLSACQPARDQRVAAECAGVVQRTGPAYPGLRQEERRRLTRLQACIKAQSDAIVKASMAEGDTLGVSATPTLFINGERLEGALDADEVRAALNRQLLGCGCPAAAGSGQAHTYRSQASQARPRPAK